MRGDSNTTLVIEGQSYPKERGGVERCGDDGWSRRLRGCSGQGPRGAWEDLTRGTGSADPRCQTLQFESERTSLPLGTATSSMAGWDPDISWTSVVCHVWQFCSTKPSDLTHWTALFLAAGPCADLSPWSTARMKASIEYKVSYFCIMK